MSGFFYYICSNTPPMHKSLMHTFGCLFVLRYSPVDSSTGFFVVFGQISQNSVKSKKLEKVVFESFSYLTLCFTAF